MREIVADVWLGGYAGECVVQAATSVKVVGHATKVDEFGDLTPETENERLANAASAVAQNNDTIYLIAYAGRSNVRGYAVTALRRMKSHLGSIIGHPDRVGTIDGGFREAPAYEVWVVPVGADIPKPSPTVDRKEIVFPKTVPTRPATVRKT